MADAYKLIADGTFPEVIRTVVNVEGVEINETVGRTYNAGDYVLAEHLTPRDRERAENGELDHLLEAADRGEAEAALSAVDRGTFIAEHEAERYILKDAGHSVVEKDQVLELRSAGAEAAQDALAASKSSGAYERNITEKPAEKVSEAQVEKSGVELPPGLPVGPTLAKAGGADPDEVDAAVEKSSAPKRRRRPGTEPSQPNEPKSGQEQ